MARRRLFLPVTVLSMLLCTTLLTVHSPATAQSGARAKLAATKVTVKATKPTARLKNGQKAFLTGKVTGSHRSKRVVRLQQWLPSGWRNVRQTRSNGAGNYRIAVSTNWLHSLRVRIKVDATKAAAAAYSQPRTVTVKQNYTALGKPAQHSVMGAPSWPWRFEPCRPVTYRINVSAVPGAYGDVREAVRRLGVATGITFRYLGTTKAIPPAKKNWQAGTDLVIAFARPGQTSWNLNGSVVGMGGPIDGDARLDAKGRPVAVTNRAGAVIDVSARLKAGFGKNSDRGEVIMHELGHAAGLNHSPGAANQIMTPHTLKNKYARWGHGDMAGLRKVGLMQGCTRPWSSKAARTVDDGHRHGSKVTPVAPRPLP